ncbi:cell division protein FtsN [Aliivibrio fischeri]|uniref:Cell division protein FtsN n=2 Tax=Aliivibrio fischeri TaxID=668 RepID=Q5E2H5_ALIF1|nr:cell division protein FtsN [Aliivibrio fischeri ES114]MUJ21212.1 cell division protein FtsN [Aliivibrio fischeri]MUK37099.1 cell division protein FtsN [Aliivibrio fischeri]MUK45602.1 cell division protein FtsN [Aliivibrio fischeri]MUK62559.1 cell division protein FtsN [Aliivibrio fischeri]
MNLCKVKIVANKDYVKRGRSPKKATKKTTKKKGAKQPMSNGSTPWKAVAVAALLVMVFGYALYFLNDSPEPEVKAPVTEVVPVKPKKTTSTEDIPPLPEEQWSYMDELPNKEITVEQKELKVSEIPYIMQCGAYKNRSQAEERKMNIAFQGITSTVRHAEGSSWYKVVLGPYKFKRDAEKDRHKLQRAKIEPCAIWKDQ